jgi:hypothetical protein
MPDFALRCRNPACSGKKPSLLTGSSQTGDKENMKIIPIENKGIEKFTMDQQHQLRHLIGLDETWCGTINASTVLHTIYNLCNENIDTVQRLLTSGDSGAPTSAKLYRDQYLGVFVFKSMSNTDDLEMRLLTAIYRTHKDLMEASKQTELMRAMELKVVKASDYNRLAKSIETAQRSLCSLENRVKKLETLAEENTDKKEPGEACSST